MGTSHEPHPRNTTCILQYPNIFHLQELQLPLCLITTTHIRFMGSFACKYSCVGLVSNVTFWHLLQALEFKTHLVPINLFYQPCFTYDKGLGKACHFLQELLCRLAMSRVAYIGKVLVRRGRVNSMIPKCLNFRALSHPMFLKPRNDD